MLKNKVKSTAATSISGNIFRLVLILITILALTFLKGNKTINEIEKVKESKFSVVNNKKDIPITELNVPILTYHQVRNLKSTDSLRAQRFIVSIDAFEAQIKKLHDEGYVSIGLDDLLNGFEYNSLPAKPVILTFDDGYKSQYENALPILEKYNMKATFFVYTSAISYLGISMNWDEIKDLEKRGMTIASHTKTHPKLIFINNDNELYDEVENSKIILEGKLGHEVKYFAYPYGLNDDKVRREVEDAGYKAAVTTEEGLVQSKNNIFKLKRFNMNTEREMKFLPYSE